MENFGNGGVGPPFSNPFQSYPPPLLRPDGGVLDENHSQLGLM